MFFTISQYFGLLEWVQVLAKQLYKTKVSYRFAFTLLFCWEVVSIMHSIGNWGAPTGDRLQGGLLLGVLVTFLKKGVRSTATLPPHVKETCLDDVNKGSGPQGLMGAFVGSLGGSHGRLFAVHVAPSSTAIFGNGQVDRLAQQDRVRHKAYTEWDQEVCNEQHERLQQLGLQKMGADSEAVLLPQTPNRSNVIQIFDAPLYRSSLTVGWSQRGCQTTQLGFDSQC